METEISTLLLSLAAVVVPALGAAVVAWLRMKTRQWANVRAAVDEAESLGERMDQSPAPLSPDEKHAFALMRIKASSPKLPEAKASQMIEAVLPSVRQSRQPPTPRGP